MEEQGDSPSNLVTDVGQTFSGFVIGGFLGVGGNALLGLGGEIFARTVRHVDGNEVMRLWFGS